MVKFVPPFSKIAVRNNTNDRCLLAFTIAAAPGSGADQFVEIINRLQAVNSLIVNPFIGPGVTFTAQSIARPISAEELGMLGDQLHVIATDSFGYNTVDGSHIYTTADLTLGLPKQCRIIRLKVTQASNNQWHATIAYGSMTVWSGNAPGTTRTYNVTECTNIG